MSDKKREERYRVLRTQSVSELEQIVNEHMYVGWLPLEGMIEIRFKEFFYAQTMMLPDTERADDVR